MRPSLTRKAIKTLRAHFQLRTAGVMPTVPQIAEHADVHPQTAYYHVKRLGLSHRPKPNRSRQKHAGDIRPAVDALMRSNISKGYPVRYYIPCHQE